MRARTPHNHTREAAVRSPCAAADSTRTVALPGVSLFILNAIGDGCCVVRCPGCHAEHMVPPGETLAFAHADGACPVLRTIEAALEAFRDGPMETCA